MRIEYIKDSEPHFKGSVVEVDSETGDRLVEAGVAKEVDPRTDLKNVAADMSQDGMSITDKRARGLMEGGDKPAKTSKKDEAPAESNDGDKYDDMKGDELKAELEKRGLAKSGSVDELRDRLRDNDKENA